MHSAVCVGGIGKEICAKVGNKMETQQNFAEFNLLDSPVDLHQIKTVRVFFGVQKNYKTVPIISLVRASAFLNIKAARKTLAAHTVMCKP